MIFKSFIMYRDSSLYFVLLRMTITFDIGVRGNGGIATITSHSLKGLSMPCHSEQSGEPSTLAYEFTEGNLLKFYQL